MTKRGASGAWITELEKPHGSRPVWFFFADFGDRGIFACWSGYSARVLDGVTYHGSGELVSISNIVESQRGRTDSTTVALASNDAFDVRDHVQDVLLANFHGRRAKVTKCFLTDGGTLVAGPPLMDGEISSLDYAEQGLPNGGVAPLVQCTIVEVGGDEDRSLRHRITPESQKAIDDTDQGLKNLARDAQVKINFGGRYARRVKED